MQSQPITDEQEWTLRRWASTVGKRPRKRDKAFLQAEKGLTEEQIDGWWKRENSEPAPLKRSKSRLRIFRQPSINILNDVERMPLNAPVQEAPQLDLLEELNFGALGAMDERAYPYTPSPIPATQNWSPMGLPQENFSSPVSYTLEMPQHEYSWPLPIIPHHGIGMASTPPLEATPLLLPGHRRYMSGSDRSSYGSSAQTWDSASTLVSICDMYTDGHQQHSPQPVAVKSKLRPQIKLTKLNRTPTRPKTNHAPLIEDSKSQPVLTRANSTVRPPPNHIFPESGTCKKEPGKYHCTVCHRCFSRKGDWKRHEDNHDPQTYYTCMLGEPAIFSANGWTCVFCPHSRPTRREMVIHLINQHKIYICTNKKLEDRTFTRKDKLKQHLQQVHALADESTLWESWSQGAPKKWAWGCGFCGVCCFTWEGRLGHIAEHYEKNHLATSRWSTTLAVKGLLKQVYHDFNISEPWKRLIAGIPTGERLLEWSPPAAAALKQKLEFHEGSPKEIAEEAYQLALENSPAVDIRPWNASNSVTPMVLELGVASWQDSTSRRVSQAHPYQPDIEMVDADSRYF